jgi:hypothetical protein
MGDFDLGDFFELCTVVGRAAKGAASIKTFRGSQPSFTTLKSHGIHSVWDVW